MAAQRLVLVDGTWLIFRAYFALPTSLRTSTGVPTNAVYGFATMFRKLLAGKSPSMGAVVFDAPGRTFREERFPAYKAQRPPIADDLRVQIPWIERLVAAHDFPMLSVPGFEADDIIGTLATRGLAAGYDVHIISGDKDFAQLVCDRLRLVDTMRDVSYDRELVRKKWGVYPEQFIDYLALTGDKVDNIPGVPGVGAKTAARLLDDCGSLDGVFAHLDALKGKLKENLETHRDDAVLSRELATIVTDVDLELDLAELAVPEPDIAKVNALLQELEFYSLLTRDAQQTAARKRQVAVVSCTTLDEVRAHTRDARGSLVAIYPLFQNESDAPKFGGLAGLAVATSPESAFYVPLVARDVALGAAGLEALRPLCEDSETAVVAHDAKVLWRELRRRGVRLEGVVGDTMLGSFLVNPTRIIPHGLTKVVKEYLQRVPAESKAVIGSGQSVVAFGDVDVEEAAGFAGLLATSIFEVWPLLETRLNELGLHAHLLEHELPLTRVLGQMELDGVLVDSADLARLQGEFEARLEQLERDIHGQAGHPFHIASTKALGAVLFEELGLPVVKRTKTGYSTAADVLERLAPKHPIVALVLEHRQLAKLINTYTEVLRRAVDAESGRIHATLNQTVSATGRLITTDPDLQRTPIRTPEGRRIRQAFIAPEGHVLLSADWSQIELRLLAHFSGDARLVDAFATQRDVHRQTAGELFNLAPDEVTHAQRQVGKLVNFATIYGQGATALGQTLGIPRKDAKDYIDHYFTLYPAVRGWLDGTIARAAETGFVTTILGRKRIIPELTSRSPMERQAGERIAANTPIQGSAADLCKLVMLALPAELAHAGLGARLLMQIHDELVFEVPTEQVDALSTVVRTVMEAPYPLRVPLLVEIGVGASWAAAH